MTRPRLLDLCCGAGGAAMGYHRAGFDVVGIDLAPQPRYPFEFHQADALEFPLDGFDAVHASPPCQAYANVTRWRGDQAHHPDLIHTTRARLHRAGIPWVMENVPEAPLRRDLLLCGSMFGLRVKRHRAFETSWRAFQFLPSCHHAGLLSFMHKAERAYADAMGCQWMTKEEARDAIPPSYTILVGWLLLAHLSRAGAGAGCIPGPPTSSSPAAPGGARAPGGIASAPALDASEAESADSVGISVAARCGVSASDPHPPRWRPAFVDNDARPVPTTWEPVTVKPGVL